MNEDKNNFARFQWRYKSRSIKEDCSFDDYIIIRIERMTRSSGACLPPDGFRVPEKLPRKFAEALDRIDSDRKVNKVAVSAKKSDKSPVSCAKSGKHKAVENTSIRAGKIIIGTNAVTISMVLPHAQNHDQFVSPLI